MIDIGAIQAQLREEGLDGWLFYDHHRRDPLSYRILNLPDDLIPTRRWYYLIPVSGDPRALVHRIEPHSLKSLPGEVLRYSRWMEQQDQLKRLLKGVRRLAMQYSPRCAIPYVSMVDAGTAELVQSCGIQVVTSANLVQVFEAAWTDSQLESHIDAGKKVDAIRRQAFERISAELRAGRAIGEHSIQQFIRQRFQQEGLTTDHGPIVAINAHASDPHYEPSPETSAPIRENDLVLIDMWAKFDQPNSVFYDITWTGYCGANPPDKMVRVFDVVAAARDRAVECVKFASGAGQSLQGFEVDDAARSYIEQQGFGEYFIHRTGHSIGTNVHGAGANMDNFETHDERRILPRTCFSVEPGVYLPDFGIRSEVNVYVDIDNARVTGEIQTHLLRLL